MKKNTQAVAVKTEETKKHIVKVQPAKASATKKDVAACRPIGV